MFGFIFYILRSISEFYRGLALAIREAEQNAKEKAYNFWSIVEIIYLYTVGCAFTYLICYAFYFFFFIRSLF